MKPQRGISKLIDKLSFLSLGPLKLAALAIPLLLAMTVAASAQATNQSRAHVYLFRGLMNVFSLGMDEIADQLQKRQIEATVYNHLLWWFVADEIAAEYKSGRVQTIILIGHSAGAAAVTSLAARLGELGVPVKLAIGLDPITHQTASGSVALYLNFYVGNGPGQTVEKGRQFSGTLKNVNVDKDFFIGHFFIDKDKAVQAEVISAVLSAL